MAVSLHDFEDDEAELSEINMVPLIDVMLVMLIIFMITVPVLTQRVPVDLPRATAATDIQEPDRISIAVDAEGKVFWNDEPIDAMSLQLRLEDAARQEPQPELHIRGDRKAEYESVLQVMAAAQRAGVQKLGFVTLPGDAEPVTPSANPDDDPATGQPAESPAPYVGQEGSSAD